MNLTTVKALSEIHLAGVTVDWTKEDKGIKEVRIRDGNGGDIIIKSADTYSQTLKVLVPQPFEEAERFILSGKFLGLTDVREVFEDKYAADAKLGEYADAAGYGKDTGLSITKAKVKIDDAGTPRTIIGDDGSDIPF